MLPVDGVTRISPYVSPAAAYLFAGFAYWLTWLVTMGEPASVRSSPPVRRIKIHLVALGLSLVLWPMAVASARRG